MTNAPPPGRQDDKCRGDGHARNSVLKHYVVLSTYKGPSATTTTTAVKTSLKKGILHPFKLQRTLSRLFGIARFVKCEICPEMQALAKMAEMALNRQNRQTINKNSNEKAKGPFGKWRFWRKWQPPRGHFWHPIQIASFAIACISGHKCLM